MNAFLADVQLLSDAIIGERKVIGIHGKVGKVKTFAVVFDGVVFFPKDEGFEKCDSGGDRRSGFPRLPLAA